LIGWSCLELLAGWAKRSVPIPDLSIRAVGEIAIPLLGKQGLEPQ